MINFLMRLRFGKTELKDIDGEVFEERMVGTDNNLLWHIIQEFAHKGNLSKKVEWIKY